VSYIHIPNTYRPEAAPIFLFRTCYALEKVHGTSAHVTWSDGQLHLSPGGADAASFEALFDRAALADAFRAVGHRRVVVYGEAHGGPVQGQEWRYGPALRFVAFDVLVGARWLDVPRAEAFARRLGVGFVHYAEVPTDLASLDAERDAPSVQAARNGVEGARPREGVVLRPTREFALDGEPPRRVIAKHRRDAERETASPRPVGDPASMRVIVDAEAAAEEWATPARLAHVLDKLPAGLTARDTGRVVAAVLEDVLREGGPVKGRPSKPRVGELVQRSWDIPETSPPADTSAFERRMAREVEGGLVRAWDDGRGRWMWYDARPGPDERSLRDWCVGEFGHACAREPRGVRAVSDAAPLRRGARVGTPDGPGATVGRSMRRNTNGGPGCRQYVVRLYDGRVRHYGSNEIEPTPRPEGAAPGKG